MNEAYQIIRIDDETWRIEDGMVRVYLLAGSAYALLVDTGMDDGEDWSLRELTRSFTDKPILLVNTHSDPDHVGRNREFGPAHIYRAEVPYYEKNVPGGAYEILEAGDVLELGLRRFEVIHLPGHTPGSIALLDRDNRILIGGDTVSAGPVFMFPPPMRDLRVYMESLRRLPVRSL